MFRQLQQRFSRTGIDLRLFFTALAIASFGGSMVDATFNNFLSETFNLSSLQRSFLEIPREVPGLLVMFVSALLCFLGSRRMAAFAMILGAAGLVLIALFSDTLPHMLVWLFLFSLGQHLLIPLQAGIGMELARDGRTGRRLGQLNALRNFCAIGGSFCVFLGFRFFHLSFKMTFLAAAAGLLVAGLLLGGMEPGQPQAAATRLKLHRDYGLFYWLAILYGTRKQIFLTFAPWVLVTVYKQPTQALATLLTIGGFLGIVFQPLLGRLIDTRGERFVLAGEAAILIGICVLYGFSEFLFPRTVAFLVVAACYVADHLLMSVSMARATYLKKIVSDPEHITPALYASTSIDHVFAISAAVLCGVIWEKWGYQYVFLIGAGIAVVNLFSARLIRLPAPNPVA